MQTRHGDTNQYHGADGRSWIIVWYYRSIFAFSYAMGLGYNAGLRSSRMVAGAIRRCWNDADRCERSWFLTRTVGNWI